MNDSAVENKTVLIACANGMIPSYLQEKIPKKKTKPPIANSNIPVCSVKNTHINKK